VIKQSIWRTKEIRGSVINKAMELMLLIRLNEENLI
jgi:hypothetical protein